MCHTLRDTAHTLTVSKHLDEKRNSLPYYKWSNRYFLATCHWGWPAFGYFSRFDSFLNSFSFYFHIIPFGIGFNEGTTIWFIITLIFFLIVKAYFSSKRKLLFLSLTVGPIILLLTIRIIRDYSKNLKWKEFKAESQSKNEIDFNHIKTGDLLFQVIAKDSLDSSFQFTDSLYNNMELYLMNMITMLFCGPREILFQSGSGLRVDMTSILL